MDNILFVQKECPLCHNVTSVKVDSVKYAAWNAGQGCIQNVMPELTAAEREVLMSGICGVCQEFFFNDNDEEEEEDTGEHEYRVIVEETVSEIFTVKADSLEEAKQKIIDGYHAGDYVLEPGDVCNRQLHVISKDDKDCCAEDDWEEF